MNEYNKSKVYNDVSMRLKKATNPDQPRLKFFDLEKLRDPDVACTFPTIVSGKFVPPDG